MPYKIQRLISGDHHFPPKMVVLGWVNLQVTVNPPHSSIFKAMTKLIVSQTRRPPEFWQYPKCLPVSLGSPATFALEICVGHRSSPSESYVMERYSEMVFSESSSPMCQTQSYQSCKRVQKKAVPKHLLSLYTRMGQ